MKRGDEGSYCSRSNCRSAILFLALGALMVANLDGRIITRPWAGKFERVRGWPVVAVSCYTSRPSRPNRWTWPFGHVDVLDTPGNSVLVDPQGAPVFVPPAVIEFSVTGIVVDVVAGLFVLVGVLYSSWRFRARSNGRFRFSLAVQMAGVASAATIFFVFKADVGRYLDLISAASHTIVWLGLGAFWLAVIEGIGRMTNTRQRENNAISRSQTDEVEPPTGSE